MFGIEEKAFKLVFPLNPFILREAAKINRNVFLFAVPLRPYHPTPSSLMAVGTFFFNYE